MSLRLAAVLTALVVLLALGGIVYVQTQRLESTERQLDETRDALDATKRAIEVLQAERIEAERRKAAAAAGREAIVSVPEGNDPGVGESLLRALQAADEIGGLE